MKNNSNRLAIHMLIAMVAGIAVGLGFMLLRENLGRVSMKNFGWFLLTTMMALVLAGSIALICFNAGMFNTSLEGLSAASGSTGANPLT